MTAPKYQASASLAVAICTYKRRQGLHRLLTALVPQVAGRPERAIIVINDGSHDHEYQSVIDGFSGKIQYHPLPRNVGIAAARNEAVRHTDAEYVVFTDDDCLPPPFWLDWLTARLAVYPDLDVVAGGVRPLMAERPGFFARVQARHGILTWPHKTYDGLRFVTANVAIRRKLFWDLGGFRISDDFPGAGEDTELSVRVSRSDCSRCLDDHWFVEHEVGDGFLINLRRYRRYGYANMLSLRTTAALAEHGGLKWRSRQGRFKIFLEEYQKHLPTARGISNWRALQWLSAFLTSLIFVAYQEGAAQAARRITSQQDGG